MKSKTIRLNEKQIKILKDSLLASIKICDSTLFKREPDEQAVFDAYKDELFVIYRKLV